MSSSVIAVYPGTFDPITLGHEDIVRRAARLFGTVVLGVAIAHHKKTLFSLEARMAMVQEALADCPNVRVASFQGLVRDFARAQGATVMVRGVRSMTDFDYEFQLSGMNRHLAPEVETIFLNALDIHQCVSSTMVREITLLGGEVERFVSSGVLRRLNAHRPISK
ncbi:MAG: pantetheine-phosphate adenylyltransferase [Alphaproteobacteria bacterium]|nr:pantetheine-phosphate adenylyltransferase [Alphaproteobacteria bacterium]